MSGLFATSKVQRRHGAYCLNVRGTPVFTPKGTGVAAIVAQFPWGPSEQLISPAGTKDRLDMFCPAGMDHLSTGYLAISNKAWPTLKVVRACASTAATATCLLVDGATTIVTVAAKYPGSAINTVGTCVVSDASDGNVNHFNLLVSVTGDSGSTTDVFKNLDATASTMTVSELGQALLVGGFTVTNTGRPDNGTYTFSGGTSPAVASADYVGTAGTGNRGLALLENDKTINHVFVDDCGNSLRSAVNAGVQAHAILMGDRIGYINGNSGQTAANVLLDKANYTNSHVVYVDPWVYVLDDVTGAKHLVPGSPFAASVASQLVTSTAISWKGSEVRSMLSGIVGVEYNRGDATGDNTENGICTVIQEGDGGFTFEADVTCAYPIDPTEGYLTDVRFKILVAKTFVENTRESIDAPLVGPVTQPILDALSGMMDTFVANSKNTDAVHLDQCKDYAISDLHAENSAADLAAGRFTIPLQIQESSSLRWLFLALQAGEAVQPQHNQ